MRETPLDPDWVEATLNSLEHLVLAGDEANLAERVVELITAPRRRRGDGRLRRVASRSHFASDVDQRQIGAFAGLAAFLGLAVLALLSFTQGRDIRRLREWAGSAPERDAERKEATSTVAAAAGRGAADARGGARRAEQRGGRAAREAAPPSGARRGCPN